MEEKQHKEKIRFKSLLKIFDVVEGENYQRMVMSFPFVFFLVVLAFIHIANNHIAENYVRNISKTENEIKQLRWRYITTASALVKISKQSEVNKLVAETGIKELRQPPYIITVEKITK